MACNQPIINERILFHIAAHTHENECRRADEKKKKKRTAKHASEAGREASRRRAKSERERAGQQNELK